MEKPEKSKEDFTLGRRDLIRNKTIDEMDAYYQSTLPIEEEIEKIVCDIWATMSGASPLLRKEIIHAFAVRIGTAKEKVEINE